MKTRRVTVEVSEGAYLKLMAEEQRRIKDEGRGKKYPRWRIVDELLHTLAPARPSRAGLSEEDIAHARK